MQKSSITQGTVFCKNEGLLSNKIGNETVMMSIDKGLYFGLDPVGSQIWGLLKQPVSVSQVCDRLTEKYDVSPEHCEKEVIHFLDEMLKQDIVKIVENESPEIQK